MPHVIYIISEIDKALSFEWIAQSLPNDRCTLEFILLNRENSLLETYLKGNRIQVQRIHLYKNWKMIFTFLCLWLLLFKKRPDIIHTHLRFASLLGITAGFFSGIK